MLGVIDALNRVFPRAGWLLAALFLGSFALNTWFHVAGNHPPMLLWSAGMVFCALWFFPLGIVAQRCPSFSLTDAQKLILLQGVVCGIGLGLLSGQMVHRISPEYDNARTLIWLVQANASLMLVAASGLLVGYVWRIWSPRRVEQ
jgi:hypothetical protein